MAFKKKTTTTKEKTTEKAINGATFTMCGVVSDVYEGKKYNYLTVNVDGDNINPKTGKPYYNTFRVQCEKSVALPLDESPATITGRMSSFFDRDKQLTEYTFIADAVTLTD